VPRLRSATQASTIADHHYGFRWSIQTVEPRQRFILAVGAG
jgi:hypothetical protein